MRDKPMRDKPMRGDANHPRHLPVLALFSFLTASAALAVATRDPFVSGAAADLAPRAAGAAAAPAASGTPETGLSPGFSADLSEEPSFEGEGHSGADPEPVGDPVEKAHREAYKKSLAELLPVTPEEIRTYREESDKRDRALTDAPPGKLRTRTVRLSPDPGFMPPTVELTPNLVTALVFLDSTGMPWPLSSSVLGSGALYGAEVLEGEKRNAMTISPLTQHGNSNLIVTLEGLDIPLVLRLETKPGLDGKRDVDGLVMVQVRARGPEALPFLSENALDAPVSDLLYAFLDGLSPEGTIPLRFSPDYPDTTLAKNGPSFFLRTRASLMWPRHKASVAGAGGFKVYEIPPTPRLLVKTGEDITGLRVETPGAEMTRGGANHD
ncbi:MAG: DotH/IcmK family type IV secretion protein [Deltaproteobacteria bacterium]|jgi:intracellular multiplication protein IcmK|nr:DotH/IcmK family type IV secretion protein [Deltaproteobacteria bacterium]